MSALRASAVQSNPQLKEQVTAGFDWDEASEGSVTALLQIPRKAHENACWGSRWAQRPIKAKDQLDPRLRDPPHLSQLQYWQFEVQAEHWRPQHADAVRKVQERILLRCWPSCAREAGRLAGVRS